MIIDFIPKVQWIVDCQFFKVWDPEFGIDIIFKCWLVIDRAL